MIGFLHKGLDKSPVKLNIENKLKNKTTTTTTKETKAK